MPTQHATIGSYLKALRKSRRTSMVQAAKEAGVHRATLDRWERGDNEPRLAELESLLAALGASSRQKADAIRLMEAPRAIRLVRTEIDRLSDQNGIGPMPHGGDLLHALRMRRGLSWEETAALVGVSTGTLRRWEKMEVWPSIEQVHRLCYVLGAKEEEIVALTVGRFSGMPRAEKVTVESIRARLDALRALCDAKAKEGPHLSAVPLLDLTYLEMEADAWSCALRSEAGRLLLIELYAVHSHALVVQERLREAAPVADRALDLMSGGLKPDLHWLYAVIAKARAIAFGGVSPSPGRGLERLRPWVSMNQWPAMHAWMMADAAIYLSLSARSEAALAMVEQSCRLTAKPGLEIEASNRRFDKAAVLLQSGRAAEALAIAQEKSDSEAHPSGRIQKDLVRAEAYIGVGDVSEAHNCLQRARVEVDTYHVELMRGRLERLAARL